MRTIYAPLVLACLVMVSSLLALAPTAVGSAKPKQAQHQQVQPVASQPANRQPEGGITPEVERARFDAAADYSSKYGGRAVLVQRGGKRLFDRYDNGWSEARPHPLASGTKSFTGVMAMMAVQDGLLTLDERVCETLTEWKSDPRKSRVTVRELLSLSSGLESGDGVLSSGGGSRLLGDGARDRERRLGIEGRTKVDQPADLAKAALGLSCVTEPGTEFRYGPSHFYVFCELLNRKLAAKGGAITTTGAYLEQRVFKDIGIGVARIGKDRAGNPNLPGGCMLTAREWVKFGQFVLDGGSVTDADGVKRQLLRPELLAECFVPSKTNASYGLTWWLRNSAGDGAGDGAGGGHGAGIADTRGGGGGRGAQPAKDEAGNVRGSKERATARERLMARLRERNQEAQMGAINGPDGKPVKLYMAAGLGKQRLYVLPQFDMVVVRFAEASSEGRGFDDRTFLATVLGLTGADVNVKAPAKPAPGR